MGFAAVFGNFHGVFSLCFTVRPQPVPSPQIQPNEPYCESSLRPRHELTGTHLMKHRPIALAGRAAALIIGLLKLIPLQFDNGFNKICCIVTVYYI